MKSEIKSLIRERIAYNNDQIKKLQMEMKALRTAADNSMGVIAGQKLDEMFKKDANLVDRLKKENESLKKI